MPVNGRTATDSVTYISYGESFSYLRNAGTITDMLEDGEFKLWAFADNGSTDVTVDSLKVVVTFTAGK